MKEYISSFLPELSSHRDKVLHITPRTDKTGRGGDEGDDVVPFITASLTLFAQGQDPTRHSGD